MYTRILAANDGSPGGQKALGGAIELARKISAELHMVTVEELPRFPASID
jgi:nucleotide-binding universal stress UspA family protein